VQQGDSLDSTLLSRVIHEVTSKVKANLKVWYRDDECIGDPQTVLSNATMFGNGLSLIGLEIN